MKNEKKVPHVVLGGLIVNQNGKLLLARSQKWDDKFVMFGGHLEWSETVDDGIKREILEETGLNVEVIDRLNFQEHIATDGHYVGKHMILLRVLCMYSGDLDKVILNDEFSGEYVWVTVDEALKLDLGGDTENTINKYRESLLSKEYLNDLQRLQADFANYKKRQQEAQKELAGYLIEKLVMEITPVLDNFQMATSHVPAEEATSPWVVGIQYIEKQLEKVLADNGMQVIEARVGDVFDPRIHEAISSEEKSTDGKEETETSEHQIVSKVLQKGYKIGEKVIRPAKVAVK